MRPILALILLCSPAFGTSVCVRTTNNPQRNYDGSVTQSMGYGTAVVIAEDGDTPHRWIALTAKHVVRDAIPEKTSIGTGGDWIPVRSFHWCNGNEDAAFIVFDCERKFTTPALTMDDPSEGQSVNWSGYSGGKKFEKFTAKVLGIGDTGMARGETRPRQGQSGGGVYDAKGRLCGVVSGFKTDTGELIYTPMCKIQRRCYEQWGFGIGVGVGGGRQVRPNPAPVFVPEKPPAEVEPDVAPLPPTEDDPPKPRESNASIQRQLDELRELIKSAPGCRCVNKDRGVPSANLGGCKCKGPCQCDLSKLVSEIEKLKTPIRVQILKADGTVIDEDAYPHGTPIKLKLTPLKK